MSRLSFFKSSKSSNSSVSSTGTVSQRSSMTSDSSQVSYVQIPGFHGAPTQRQMPVKLASKQASIPGYAEMLDDENVAWDKPKRSSRR